MILHNKHWAGARFAALLLGWLMAVAAVEAHDPGLSAISLQRQGDELVATINLAPADAAVLSSPMLELTVDARTLVPVGKPVTRKMERDVQFQWKYEMPEGKRLLVHSLTLAQLARGHREYFALTDEAGETVLSRVLSAQDDQVEFDLTLLKGAPKSLGFAAFLKQGILHIMTGYDHLLFVTALALAVVSLWDLIKVVSAFTVAHTITLTLSVFNIVRLPSAVVEPMIAGSIVFVALTNVVWPQRSKGSVRVATAFFFGLFHGLGFAGGLLDAMEGLPGMSIGWAIVAFSLGVEIGHQMVVLPVFGMMKLARQKQDDESARGLLAFRAMRYGSVVICVAGAAYLVAALRS